MNRIGPVQNSRTARLASPGYPKLGLPEAALPGCAGILTRSGPKARGSASPRPRSRWSAELLAIDVQVA